MRKLILCLACLLLAVECAFAGGLAGLRNAAELQELPDPEMLLRGGAVLHEAVFRLDGGLDGVAYSYPMPDDWELFLQEYAVLCGAAGYAVTQETQLNLPAWRVESGGKAAWLIPDYRGSLLLVVDRGIPFAPIPTPEPTATPKPTPQPQWPPSGGSSGGSAGGHVEYVTVQQDCFACVGGVCDLCNGSGVYRMYGVAVDCSRTCGTCNGTGWLITQLPVWVFDD